MSFISDLGKGFVRSAVNQVGRDGGKVISNQLYGNAHSTPIRGIGMTDKNEYINIENGEFVSPDELRNKAIEEGFKCSACKYSTATKIMWYILFLFFASILFGSLPLLGIIPYIILFVIGIRKIFQKHIYMRKTETITTFTSDKRYKTGNRISGQSESQIELKVPISRKEKGITMKIGLLYILLSFFSLYVGIQISEYVYHRHQSEQTTISIDE